MGRAGRPSGENKTGFDPLRELREEGLPEGWEGYWQGEHGEISKKVIRSEGSARLFEEDSALFVTNAHNMGGSDSSAAFRISKNTYGFSYQPISIQPLRDATTEEVLMLDGALEEKLEGEQCPDAKDVHAEEISSAALAGWLEGKAAAMTPGDALFLGEPEVVVLSVNAQGEYLIESCDPDDSYDREVISTLPEGSNAEDVAKATIAGIRQEDAQVSIPENELRSKVEILDRAEYTTLARAKNGEYYITTERYPTEAIDETSPINGGSRNTNPDGIWISHYPEAGEGEEEIEIRFRRGGREVGEEEYKMHIEEAFMLRRALAIIKEDMATA